MKNVIRILIRVALNLWIVLGSMDMLIIFILLIYEHGISFHGVKWCVDVVHGESGSPHEPFPSSHTRHSQGLVGGFPDGVHKAVSMVCISLVIFESLGYFCLSLPLSCSQCSSL